MRGMIEQVTTGRGRKYVYTAPDGSTSTVPSVTTVLGALPKGGLDWWGAKLALGYAVHAGVTKGADIDAVYDRYKATDYAPHRALTKAGNRGTDVHQVAEDLLRDGKLTGLRAGTGASEGYIDALVKWHSDFGVAEWTTIAVEARLVSLTHQFAGTVDVIAQRPDGVYVVGDFKTSKSVYESHTIQAAAYAYAAVEQGLIPADAVIETHVIRLGEDGSYEVVRGNHTIEDFLAVKAVHLLLKDKSKKGEVLDADVQRTN